MGHLGVTCHMREQSSNFSMRMPNAAVAAAALLFSLSAAKAGDPIQFSPDKSKPAPTETRPVETDVFKSWNKGKAPASRLNSLTPFITPGRPLDSKEEKRLQNARDERKNWMLLEPGELQERDEQEENEFAGNGLKLDDMEEEADGNYLFYNVTQQKSDNAQGNSPRNTARETEEQPKKDGRSSLSVFGPRETEKHGAHTASELNLKGLIDPSQLSADKFNKNEASLFQFFKDNAPPANDRDQQARRDTFRNFINGPQPGGPPAGASDPINFRMDLTQERFNPTMPSRPAFELPAPARSADSLSTRAPLGGFSPARAPGFPETVTLAPRPMAGPHLPSPLLTPNEAARTPRASMFNREGPRRGGL
jgi:hypothetical protein